jgi:hypothetical protein
VGDCSNDQNTRNWAQIIEKSSRDVDFVMTEKQWLKCGDPLTALEFIARSDNYNSRKIRLFSCASWHWIARRWKDDRCRAAVEVAERFSDGVATDDELRIARATVERFLDRLRSIWSDRTGHNLACAALAATAPDAFLGAQSCILREADRTERATERHSALQETRGFLNFIAGMVDHLKREMIGEDQYDFAQIRIIRDLFGNPFRKREIDDNWRSSTVMSVAEGLYEESAFGQLPILADALEESGCSDSDILQHCRASAVHVRGCWVLDLVLGKA